jgi:hypothetical protein
VFDPATGEVGVLLATADHAVREPGPNGSTGDLF